MLPYWFLFSLTAYFALTHSRATMQPLHTGHWSALWWMMFAFLVLMIGLRQNVGADWDGYIEHINQATGVSLVDALGVTDPAYSFLCWIGAHWGGIYLVNTICAAFFSWGLVTFCQAQPLPWLSLLVAMPYLVIVIAMGYTRQGVAIGIAMIALVKLDKGGTLPFILWIAVAALFHKSAVILAPMAVFAGTRHKLWVVIWISVAAILLYVLLLRESVETFQHTYIEQEYESMGAAYRIGMNALSALFFLFFRRKYELSREQQSFWAFMAWSALAFVGLLYLFSSSSVAVDRMALYWIPLQLFVWSRLPNALGSRSGNNLIWISLVVGYSAAVLFVWLMFATNASKSWLPYKFFPWEWLWQ